MADEPRCRALLGHADPCCAPAETTEAWAALMNQHHHDAPDGCTCDRLHHPMRLAAFCNLPEAEHDAKTGHPFAPEEAHVG